MPYTEVAKKYMCQVEQFTWNEKIRKMGIVRGTKLDIDYSNQFTIFVIWEYI